MMQSGFSIAVMTGSSVCLRGLYLTLALVLALLLAAGAAASTAVQFEAYGSPPGRLLKVGTSRLHLYCKGSGSPTVLFESGLGGFSLDWWKVQERLSGGMRACSYDRAGYGWSEAGRAPRTALRIARELAELAAKAGLETPYVLVGHSFGGYIIRSYAGLYPQRVAGLVLVEASHPQQAQRIPDARIRSSMPPAYGRQLVGFFSDPGIFLKYPQEVRDIAKVILPSLKTFYTQRQEFLSFKNSAAQVAKAQLPQVPLVVVTRGRRTWPDTPLGRAQEKSWRDMQRELVDLVPGGEQRVAGDSGHQVHLEQPDEVVEAVWRVIELYCRESECMDWARQVPLSGVWPDGPGGGAASTRVNFNKAHTVPPGE